MDVIALKDIKPGLKNINVIFIVLEVGSATVTKENREVRNFKVGDPSACINVSIWDEPGKLIGPGDIVKLTKGYASIWRHCLTLYSGKNGEVYKIGDFCMIFNEQVNMSEPIQIRSEQQQPTAQIMTSVSSVQSLPTVGASTVVPVVANKTGNLPLTAAAGTGGGSAIAATKTTQSSTAAPANTKNNRGGRANSTRGGALKAERR